MNAGSGYTANIGDTFTVLTSSGVSGDFATKNLPVVPGHLVFNATYVPASAPTALDLDVLLPPSLGTTSLVEGPASGTDSDIVVDAGSWSATSNAAWLHTTANGTGNGIATFTFDMNPGATRTGTLTIGDQTLSVTQAGVSYVAANPFTALVSSGLSYPEEVAVDNAGNVYIADNSDNAIKEWNAATQTVVSLVSSGLSYPDGVAVDSAGNVYIADTGDNALKEWNPATQTLTTLVSSLNHPEQLAVDAWGNVYIADTGDNAIKEWNAATQTVSTLVSSGLYGPGSVAVDASGNVYIADSGDNAIKEWNAATQTVSTLVSSGPNTPEAVAVDASGNVYIASTNNDRIEEWNAATQTVSTLISSGLS